MTSRDDKLIERCHRELLELSVKHGIPQLAFHAGVMLGNHNKWVKRFGYLQRNYFRVSSVDMSGNHVWSGVGRPLHERGESFVVALDKCMGGVH